MTGRLIGIARRAATRAPMEVIARAEVTLDAGIEGDFRGRIKPGSRGRRQVSLMEAGDWARATAELGVTLPWHSRRANLLLDGFDLPQTVGARIAIGGAVFEITTECDPCSRMEEIADGLYRALLPDWRGGALARVIAGGSLALGDAVTLVPADAMEESA